MNNFVCSYWCHMLRKCWEHCPDIGILRFPLSLGPVVQPVYFLQRITLMRTAWSLILAVCLTRVIFSVWYICQIICTPGIFHWWFGTSVYDNCTVHAHARQVCSPFWSHKYQMIFSISKSAVSTNRVVYVLKWCKCCFPKLEAWNIFCWRLRSWAAFEVEKL